MNVTQNGDDQVKMALINMRKKLQGDEVEDEEMTKEPEDKDRNIFNKKVTRPPGRESTCTSNPSHYQ